MFQYVRLLAPVILLAVLSRPALAQQPAPMPMPTPTPATAPDQAMLPGETIGQTYTVEVRSGTSFIGVLTTVGPDDLTFQTKDLGLLIVKRVDLKQLAPLSAEQARRGFDYQGNGNRLFFAPTARNLRKGEGTVQTIDILLLGVNYGITENFSMGALFTWIPDAGTDNLFALTPKISFPVSEHVRVGAGALAFFQKGGNVTVAYGNTTYGSADSNLTAGVGYALVQGSAVNTPVFLLGGATRVSRRLSLVNETYILNVAEQSASATFIGGIAGLRLAGQRLSGGLALMYGYADLKSSGGGSGGFSNGGTLPFAEATYRFGRVK